MPKTGTFYVLRADGETAVLQDVAGGQVHALTRNPGVEAGAVVEATVEAVPPMEVAWEVVEMGDPRTIPVEAVAEPPSERARAAAPEAVGELARLDLDGEVLHVIRVEAGGAAAAVTDVVDDEATVARAARLGADRVEVRGEGALVSVRYRGV
jgi:hypothetical protein